ncbi:MAG: hypothetical protein NTY65_04400, partial [Planctomycetota bacterium]|nr:hypothetical protein [Planctomycetota bacterium]
MADDAESPMTPAAEAALGPPQAVRLRAALPGELRDASRLQYTLETLLGPLGLAPDFETQPAPAADAAALSWPGRPGQTEVDLSRLRDAFAAISGERERNLLRDHLGRVAASVLKVDCRRPIYSEWAREIGHALAALNPTWQPP